jgi:hypothetical protein
MNREERTQYIFRLEAEQAERNLEAQLAAAKRASQQDRIAFVTSFIAASTTNLVLATFGLARRNDKE